MFNEGSIKFTEEDIRFTTKVIPYMHSFWVGPVIKYFGKIVFNTIFLLRRKNNNNVSLMVIRQIGLDTK